MASRAPGSPAQGGRGGSGAGRDEQGPQAALADTEGFEECAETVNGGVGAARVSASEPLGLDFTKGLEEEVEPFDPGRMDRVRAPCSGRVRQPTMRWQLARSFSGGGQGKLAPAGGGGGCEERPGVHHEDGGQPARPPGARRR